MAFVEWAFIPILIPLFAIVARPEYQASRLMSITAALTPALGNAIYTATSLLVVNLVFRGVKLTPGQRSYCNRLGITAGMFIVVVGIYGIVEKLR